VPPQSDNTNEFGESHAPEEPQEAGEFTRSFGGREDKPSPDPPSSVDSSSSQPGSLTQLLGGKSKPSPSPADEPTQLPSLTPNPADAPTTDSLTSAFEGVNAFTRDLGDLREDPFKTELGKQPRSDLPRSSPGSFTRLFGSGEGVLTPAGPEDDSGPRLPIAPKPSHPGFTSGPQEQSRPPAPEPGSFTEAFRAQEPPHSVEANRKGGSFTDQFGSPSSWPAPEPTLPSATLPSAPSRYPPAAADPFRARQDEQVPLGSRQRPATPDGGFTRLVGSYGADDAPLPDATRPSIPAPRVPQRPLPDRNFAPPGSASSPDATIAFNPRRSETEFTSPPGKSEYTMVMERSKLRTPAEVPGGGGSPSSGSPYGAGASAALPGSPQYAPPGPPQYPQFAPPAAPAWPPTPAIPPAPAWQPPQLTPPAMPQAPTLAAPALPMPPTLGDKLVPFLPLILTLTVVNFLGLLAVLIILFATRK